MHMLSKKKLFLIYFLTVILLPMLLIACKQQEYIKDRDLLYGVYWVDKYTYVGPALYLYPDGHGRFEYSGLASDWPAGEYEISGENLILKDDFTDQIYTFKIDDSQLIFCADKSAELYDYGDGTAEDGMIFVYSEELSEYYL